jgi:hypothetical protein
LVSTPESGDPSRDQGTPPRDTPPDGGDDRARGLAALFGTDVSPHDADEQGDADAAAADADRLAAFFAGVKRGEPSAPPAPQDFPAEPTPRVDRMDEVAATPATDAPAAKNHDHEDLLPLDDEDLLDYDYDPDDLFGPGDDADVTTPDDAGGTRAEASVATATPAVGAPAAAAAADAQTVETEPATISGLIAAAEQAPDEPATEKPKSERAAKREAKRAAKTAAAMPVGEFASMPRGLRAWSKGTWWAVGTSIALVAVLVGASVYVAQVRAQEAAELRVAVTEFEEAVDAADDPVAAMDAAYAEYEAAAAAARLAADSAAPSLAAVVGISDQAVLDAATAANNALIGLLDSTTLPDRPADYTPPDVATILEVGAAEKATAAAKEYSDDVSEATAQVAAATTAVTQQLAALADAQRTLGATLPATADVITAENRLARQSFRDDVLTAAAAAGAAQAAGGSGDAELLVYAAAVAALRADQARAEEVASRRSTAPAPTPTPAPQPESEPEQPEQPEPGPTEPTTP